MKPVIIPMELSESGKIFMEYGELDENSHEYLMKIDTKLVENTYELGENTHEHGENIHELVENIHET